MVSTLGAVTSTQDATLLRDAWPSTLFVSHGSLGRLPELFSGGRLDLAQLLPRYSGLVRVSRSILVRMMPAAQINDAVCASATVYLENVASYVEGLAALQAQLEAELGLPAGEVATGLFASPAGGGLPLHFDSSDVILIQLQGLKRLTVSELPAMHAPYGPPFHASQFPVADMYPQCVDGFPTPDERGLRVIDMEPGTVVFMPRGTWHSSAVSTPSLAASISVRPPLLIENVITQLRNLLLQDPRWRTPLYGIQGNAEQSAQVARTIDELLPDLQRVVPLLKSAHITSMSQTPASRIESIGWSSMFQRVPNVDVQALAEQRLPGAAMIRLRNGSVPPGVRAPELTVAETLEPVCRWIIARDASFSAEELRGEFPQFPADDILHLLTGLVGMDVLVQLWFPVLPRIPSIASATSER
ncbi:MAG: JmjC domain-containing protein [Steroidobacteraceae bacterium]